MMATRWTQLSWESRSWAKSWLGFAQRVTSTHNGWHRTQNTIGIIIQNTMGFTVRHTMLNMSHTSSHRILPAPPSRNAHSPYKENEMQRNPAKPGHFITMPYGTHIGVLQVIQSQLPTLLRVTVGEVHNSSSLSFLLHHGTNSILSPQHTSPFVNHGTTLYVPSLHQEPWGPHIDSGWPQIPNCELGKLNAHPASDWRQQVIPSFSFVFWQMKMSTLVPSILTGGINDKRKDAKVAPEESEGLLQFKKPLY